MLKEFILSYKTKKNLKSLKKESISFDKANTISLLYSSKVDFENSVNFRKTLTEQGKTIHVLIWSDEKEITDNQYYNKKSISWNGNIVDNNLNKFIARDTDYFIIPSTTLSYVEEHIISSCNAKCRVGTYNDENQSYFDFMLQNDGISNHDFYNVLLEYLQKIKV